MNKKQQTTAIFQPSQSDSGAVRIPPPQQRERRDRVVQASNENVTFEIAILVLFVFMVAAGVVGVAGGQLIGVGRPGQALIAIVTLMPLAVFTMPFITGDVAALFDSWQGERTERKYADVEETRINALRDVVLAESDIRLKQIDKEMLEIETDQTAQRLHVRMADIERRLLADGMDAGPDRTKTYVANHPQPAKVAVRDFVASCYDAHGFNPDMLYANGGMIAAAPWNSIWKNEPWCNEARALMYEHVLDDTPGQPRFRHATNAEAQREIGPT